MTMKKIEGLALVAVLFVCALVFMPTAQAGIFSDTWRYRMTVVVDTPEGEKSGSVVREVKRTAGLKIFPSMTDNISLKGEAIVIDLGGRGLLFALTSGLLYSTDYGADVVAYAFGSRDAKRKKILPLEKYPTFIRFKNPLDPKTVQSLFDVKQCLGKDIYTHDECKSHFSYIAGEHFDEAFGKGVKLKSVILETTDDPVTIGIEKYLPWLSTVSGYVAKDSEVAKSGGRMTLYERLNKYDFIARY